MTLFDRLQDATTNAGHLEKFIANNAEEIHDWFSLEPHEFLKTHHREIRNFILLKWNVIRHLDTESDVNLAFITLLLDVSERIGDLGCFLRLYDFLKRTEFVIGSRLTAASLFMIKVQQDEDYISRYDAIYDLLKIAYEEEDDDAVRVLSTVVNYYSQVINNFGEHNPAVARTLKAKIEHTIAADEYSFLNHPFLFEVLATDTSNHQVAYYHIQTLLDTFLSRDIHHPETVTGLLKEHDTPYSEMLRDVDCEFHAIRAISVKQHQLNPNADIDYKRLIHGVKIIDDEKLLFAYMYSLGLMHEAKLLSAFPFLPLSDLEKSIDVVDWGCGQGTGSMVLLDHILQNDLPLNIESITLIEPSALALSRASLHTDKYDDTTRLVTINKLINHLTPEDFNSKGEITIHLFSNILDINEIPLKDLTELIKNTFQGTNYFVCVSPYQTDTKRNRLDTFMNSFKSFDFEKLALIDNKQKYDWISTKGWTRVLRVFKAEL